LTAEWLIGLIRYMAACMDVPLLNGLAEAAALDPIPLPEDNAFCEPDPGAPTEYVDGIPVVPCGFDPALKAPMQDLAEKLVTVVQEAVQRADDGLLDALVKTANDDKYFVVETD
jgi:hypothetical protein